MPNGQSIYIFDLSIEFSWMWFEGDAPVRILIFEREGLTFIDNFFVLP